MIPSRRLYLSPPNMEGGEELYVKEAFRTNWIAPLGPNVDAFEKAISDFCQVPHVLTLNSGTSAIHLALILLGVGRGDEVIGSSFTFSASVNPIVYQGATPVFIDSEAGTWNMSPELLEAAIRERLARGKKVKAIILVHLYGMPARMDRIMSIADSYGIPVIEDAAEALGSTYRDKPLSSFGRFGILSFNGNKIITSSGGGALLSAEKELMDQARHLSAQARDDAAHYQHSKIGYNYRMSNVLAGIGRGQMEALGKRIFQKRIIHEVYTEELAKYGIGFLKEPGPEYFSNHWLTCIRLDPNQQEIGREVLRLFLEERNMESRPLWKPMHLQPVFSDCPRFVDGTSEQLFQEGLCLPSGSDMTNEEQHMVIYNILECLKLK